MFLGDLLTPAVQLEELALPKLEIIAGKDSEGVTKTPKNGEGFKIGSIAVKGLYTPCHTQDSICWYMEDGDERVVFTGDTLFHAGESDLDAYALGVDLMSISPRLRQVL